MEIMTWLRKSPGAAKKATAAQFLLGNFEYGVLRIIRRLADGAYGAGIARTLSEELKRDVALAQVYVTLDRLQEKGFITSHLSDSTPVRGGRARRVYAVESRGLQALEITAAALAAAGFSEVQESKRHASRKRAAGTSSAHKMGTRNCAQA